MKIFDLQGRTVVLNTNCLLIPELKAIVEEYKDCYLNVLSFVHFWTDPESPYDRVPEDQKEAKIRRDYPGKYTLSDPSVQAAIHKVDTLMELPEERLYKTAKIAADNMEGALIRFSEALEDLKEVDILMKVLRQVQQVAESLGQTRQARDNARINQKVRGAARIAYDQA